MTSSDRPAAVVSCDGLSKRFALKDPTKEALTRVSFSAASGAITAFVGSDGAGKTTLLRLIAGLYMADQGRLTVLGVDVRADPKTVQTQIGYMPQRFGLYDDLTVEENLDLYADLHGVSASFRQARYPDLMEMTALGPFRQRLAGQLSGGMKQKLGLACTLISTPRLLLLDEPTAGVDPLSRRELWDIIRKLVQSDRLAVIVATSYLDEADRCDHAVVMHGGKILAQGPPATITRMATGKSFSLAARDGEKPRDLQARLLGRAGVVDAVPEAGRVRVVVNQDPAVDDLTRIAPEFSDALAVPAHFEDGFMTLLMTQTPPVDAAADQAAKARSGPIIQSHEGEPPAISVKGLTKRFGPFVAVDNVSFEVGKGEIFGLLGPNGAGKTTTFRMLCGLLAVTSGQLQLSGADMRQNRAQARARMGYVAQKFSLYGLLSVRENLDFFASVYGLSGARKTQRIDAALRQFDLTAMANVGAAQLAGGFKQRLAMAAGLLHQPDILFLDEPTSGADPQARRDFWRRITDLSDQGVTVIITTHFMAEAEYCDQIAILDSGHVLAQGSPGEIRLRGKSDKVNDPTMEDAFIAIVEAARRIDSPHIGAAA